MVLVYPNFELDLRYSWASLIGSSPIFGIMSKFYVYGNGAYSPIVYELDGSKVIEHHKDGKSNTLSEDDAKQVFTDYDDGYLKIVSSIKDGFGRINQEEQLDFL